MNGGPAPFDARLAVLEQTVRSLEQRLSAVEARSTPAYDAESHTTIAADADLNAIITGAFDPVALLSLVGRTLVVLGGAYLLRALTESNVLTPPVGPGLLAHLRVDMAGDRRPDSAPRLAVCDISWRDERLDRASARVRGSHQISDSRRGARRCPPHSDRWRRVTRRDPKPVADARMDHRHWRTCIEPGADRHNQRGAAVCTRGYRARGCDAVDRLHDRLGLAAMAGGSRRRLCRAGARHWRHVAHLPQPASRVIAVQLLLLGGYVFSVAIRTLFRGREINVFEAVQVIAALAIGFGGAVIVARSAGMGGGLLVAMGLVSGAACYAAAFAFVARRQGLHQNFYFYSSLGVILVLAGSALGLRNAAPLWAMLAVAAAWTATRAHRVTLTVHAAVYFLAAAAASGLLTATAAALIGPPVVQSTGIAATDDRVRRWLYVLADASRSGTDTATVRAVTAYRDCGHRRRGERGLDGGAPRDGRYRSGRRRHHSYRRARLDGAHARVARRQRALS